MTHRRILIVDDIQSVRAALRGYLSPPVSATDLMAQLINKGVIEPTKSFDIDEASQGLEAVEMVKKSLETDKPYDIAFIDMLMPPGIGGLETIKMIRAIDKELHVVVCTALSSSTLEDLASVNDGRAPLIIHKPPTNESNLIGIVRSSKRGSFT